jgi:hypothetical protein
MPVRALVVWEPVLDTDWGSPSNASLSRISGSDAFQFWDKGRLVSRSLGEHDDHSIVWDHIEIYAPGAVWAERPPQPLYKGGPLYKVTEPFRAALVQALGKKQVAQ